MTGSECPVGVCHEKRDREAGVLEGSSVRDEGGSGDGDLGRFDLRVPLSFGGIPAYLRQCDFASGSG